MCIKKVFTAFKDGPENSMNFTLYESFEKDSKPYSTVLIIKPSTQEPSRKQVFCIGFFHLSF